MQFIIQISGPSHLMFCCFRMPYMYRLPGTAYREIKFYLLVLFTSGLYMRVTFYHWYMCTTLLLFTSLVFAHANSNHPTPTRPPHKKRNSIQKGARPFNNPPATSTAWPFGNTTNLFEVLFCNPWNAPLRIVDWHLDWRVEK